MSRLPRWDPESQAWGLGLVGPLVAVALFTPRPSWQTDSIQHEELTSLSPQVLIWERDHDTVFTRASEQSPRRL